MRAWNRRSCSSSLTENQYLTSDDPRAHEHPLELRARAQELLVLVLGAEAHDALDAGPVVPTAVEQDHLAGGRQMDDVALEIPLGLLALGRRGEGDDPADRAGSATAVMRLIAPPLPAASRPSKSDHDLQALVA